MINISTEESGRLSYQICMEKGHDPIEYADTLAGQNGLGRLTDILTKEFLSENIPDDLPFYNQSKIAVLRGFGKAAKEAGDKDTTDYVSQLVKKLTAEKESV